MTLFVVAPSFEERSLGLVQQLVPDANNDQVIMLDFNGYQNVGPYLYYRTKMLRKLQQKDIEPVRVAVDRHRPVVAMSRLNDWVERIAPSRVVVDVSVLPRDYLFGICRLLAIVGLPTSIRYYRPQEYGRNLSRGVGLVRAIPGFEGEMSTTGEVLLAIVLGFEGYKALHVWERIGPTKCVALVGDPPYRDKFLDWSKAHNEGLLNTIDGLQVRSLHTHDVKMAVSQLKAMYDDARESERDAAVILCPLGTKLQSLACFALSYHYRDVTVANVSSLRYYSKDYSKGVDPAYVEIGLRELLSWVP